MQVVKKIIKTKKRGRYKRWLKEKTKIPKSTLQSRLSRQIETDVEENESEVEKDVAQNCQSQDTYNTDSQDTISDNVDFHENISYESVDSNFSETTEPENNDSDQYSTSSESNSLFNENLYDTEHSNNSDNDSEINESSDTTSDSDEEENDKLYQDCSLSKKESQLLIMSMALRHNLPDTGLESIVKLIDCHLPNTAYKSKYNFLKKFKITNYLENFYCPDCMLPLDFDRDTLITTCRKCNILYHKKKLREDLHYFIYIPLKDQLIEVLNSKLFLELRKDCEESDVINGRRYKKLKSDNVIKDEDISIQWNTDGVNLCKSSKRSMWPIQVTINELPYRLRKNNVLLCGLWYSHVKPKMNLYSKPFVDELIELYNNGIQCTTYIQEEIINIKVHTLFASVDSVARPLVQNMKQFNGSFGCSYCLHPGEQVPVGNGTARIYTYRQKDLPTDELHMQHIITTREHKHIEKGVKGPSIVNLIPNFSIIHCCPPDYMHSCLQGVGKLFITEWFNSKNHAKEYYLGSKESEFNSRLLHIKPPTEITRTPQKN